MLAEFERSIAAELEAHAGRYAELVLARVKDELPQLFQDPDLAATADLACRSLVTEFATALSLGFEVARAHAPTAALAYVRQLAQAGVGLGPILRSYRLGQETVFELAGQLAERMADPDDRVRALARIGKLSFRFVDSVMTDIAGEYESERELFIRGSYARRQAIVRDLLAGTSVDRVEAERTLGRRLDSRHRALIAWGTESRPDQEVLTQVVLKLVRVIGKDRPLVIGDGAGTITVWTTPSIPDESAIRDAAATLREAGVQAAVGEAAVGAEGFAATKRQADLARLVARLRPEQSVTWYRDVALAAVLLRDRDAAWSFAQEELGELARSTRAAADLRRTLDAYFAAGRDQTQTARNLNMHRNTVAKRLRRAEALLERPLAERNRELEAALVIANALNPPPIQAQPAGNGPRSNA
jgi:DNA-binding PucR family transcriptional regulator